MYLRENPNCTAMLHNQGDELARRSPATTALMPFHLGGCVYVTGFLDNPGPDESQRTAGDSLLGKRKGAY
jgi:hypothetical protein